MVSALAELRSRIWYRIWGPALAPWRRNRFAHTGLPICNALISKQVDQLLLALREELVQDGEHYFSCESKISLATALSYYDEAWRRMNVAVQQVVAECGVAGADVGTAYGWVPLLLKRSYGLSVVATEQEDRIPIYSAYAIEKGLEVRPWRLPDTPAPFEDSSLDFVIFAEVLEHLKLSPRQTIQQLGTLLKPGGKLILSTPNIHRLENFQNLMAGNNILEKYKDDIPLGADPTNYMSHVREYSIAEVAEAIQAAGFELVRILMCDKSPYDIEPVRVPPQWNTIATLLARKL